MYNELNDIINLAQDAYRKGAFKDVFETLKEAYMITESEEVVELLLNMFHFSKLKEYKDNLFVNLEWLSKSKKVFLGGGWLRVYCIGSWEREKILGVCVGVLLGTRRNSS